MTTTTSTRGNVLLRTAHPAAGLRSAAGRLQRHRATLLTVGPILLLVGLVHGIGMDGAPQRIDDEGTYVAQAWSVLHLHELTHYTYWYDHPPLGWLQLAGYAGLTGAFDRAPYAVAAGREFMLVVQLISAGLLWILARRNGFPRWGAAVAVLLFGLSPLALQFHRTVYLDNIATPWLLASFVLASSPRQRLAAFTGAGVCFACAVMTKETELLLLPVLVWLLWRHSAGGTRRYAIAVSGAVLVLGCTFYLLFALLKGEIVPGANRTSLLGGVMFQIADRASSGSVFRAGSLGNVTVSQWVRLDPVLPALSLVAGVAGVAGVAVRRLRPFAVGYLILLAALLRPGYLPVPFVIGMLPLATLLVAGTVGWTWERGRAAAAVTAVAGVAAAAVGLPGWVDHDRSLLTTRPDRPMQQAAAWIRDTVPPGERILTDDALWVDLVRAGAPRQDVVWFYKPDTDPAVPTGWRNYDWVVSTDSMRTFPTSFATVTGALQNSLPMATFGSSTQRVEIRRVEPGGVAPAAQRLRAEQVARSPAGAALAANPRLDLAGGAASVLRRGDADARVITTLALAAADHRLTVELPGVHGAQDRTRRAFAVTRIDGRPVRAGDAAVRDLTALLSAQPAPYRPRLTLTRDGDVITLLAVFPLAG